MHFRTVIVLFSLGLNLVLGIGWAVYYFNNSVYSRRPIIRQAAAANAPESTNATTNSIRSNGEMTWQEVESDDYGIYVQNLRAIGCPERTIRDIIVADVNDHYTQMRSRLVLTNDFDWWRPEAQTVDTRERQQNLEKLDQERRRLLTDLLGPDWEAREMKEDPVAQSGVFLGGPVLGDLADADKEAVYEIAARGRNKMQDYLDTQEFLGQSVDPAQLAQFRNEMRTELAKVLTPTQMEEFLLRYSETAEAMRREMRGIQVSPEEFRNIFRLRDSLEAELALLGGEGNRAASGRIQAIQDQMDAAVRQALGPERYIEYRLNEDPGFRETVTKARQIGATPEATFSIYEITQETLEEEQRIRNDASLSSEEKIDALATMQAEQQKAMQRLLGPAGFQRWQQLQ